MAKKNGSVVEINGVTLKPGVECFLVRDRMTIATATDARERPSDVTKAKFKTVTTEDDKLVYVFDDLDPAQPYTVGLLEKELPEVMFADEKLAKETARLACEKWSLIYAREDFAALRLVYDFTGRNAETSARVLKEATSSELQFLARRLGLSPFTVFKGTAGDLAAQRKAFKKAVEELKAKDVRAVHEQAKIKIDALRARHGDALLPPEAQPKEKAQPKEAPAAKKAAPKATPKEAPTKKATPKSANAQA